MIKIRKYKAEDKAQAKRVIFDVLSEIFGKTVIKEWENFEDYAIFYVAEDKTNIVGTIALKDEGKGIGKLKRMYILKAYRSQGIGQKLFDNMMVFANKHKFKRIILSTEKRMVGAQKFYIKNGFRKMKKIDWETDFADLKKEDVDIERILFFEKKVGEGK